MGPNPYIVDALLARHRQELAQEREQQRLIGRVEGRSHMGRHLLGRLGGALIVVGLWFQKAERREQTVLS